MMIVNLVVVIFFLLAQWIVSRSPLEQFCTHYEMIIDHAHVSL
jgi:hypothetical protein